MESSALISLSLVSQYPPAVVGEQAVLLAGLSQAGIPVAETQIISTDTLHRLSQEMDIANILRPLLKDSRWFEQENHNQLRTDIQAALKKNTSS